MLLLLSERPLAYVTGMENRRLGVLGGMGPLASAHFMMRLTLLTPAERDQDHVRSVLWSDPTIPDRIAARRGTGPDPLPALVQGLRALEAAGCGAMAMPCNTAHGWIDGMRAATSLPILHIVDATIADLRRRGIARGPVGLMGTQATLDMALYQNPLSALGWPAILPTAAEMDRLIKPAIASVKQNRVWEANEPLVEAATALMGRGAGAVVLACTEIPLGLQAGPDSGVPMIDTVDALARAAIVWARR